jgi:uncharacterized membrane protein
MSEKKEKLIELENVEESPSSCGLKQPVAALLASLFGLVFVFVESKNRFVRYCAAMSVFIWVGLMAGLIFVSLLSAIPLVGLVFRLMGSLISFAAFGGLGFLAYFAYKGKKVKVFQLSSYAEDWSRPDDAETEDDDLKL